MNNDEYEGDIMMCVELMESILELYPTDINCAFVMMGDFNFECIRLRNSDRLSCMYNLITEYNFVVYDEMDTNKFEYTNYNESLNQFSLIDYFFISKNDLH